MANKISSRLAGEELERDADHVDESVAASLLLGLPLGIARGVLVDVDGRPLIVGGGLAAGVVHEHLLPLQAVPLLAGHPAAPPGSLSTLHRDKAHPLGDPDFLLAQQQVLVGGRATVAVSGLRAPDVVQGEAGGSRPVSDRLMAILHRSTANSCLSVA